MRARPGWAWALLASLLLHALLLFCWRPFAPRPSARAAVLTLSLPAPRAAGVPDGVGARTEAAKASPAPRRQSPQSKRLPIAKAIAAPPAAAAPRQRPSLPTALGGGSSVVEGEPAGSASTQSASGAARGGGQDSVALYRAEYLNNPRPEYPERSRENGEEGTVLLRVSVSAAGRASEVTVAVSSGYPRLDRAAKAAVESWRFAPAKRNGQAVDSVLTVPVRFQSP